MQSILPGIKGKFTLRPCCPSKNIVLFSCQRTYMVKVRFKKSYFCALFYLTLFTWEWTQKNGVQGYLVASKQNGKSIFLPAAGFVNQAGVQPTGRYGTYWSSCLIEGPWVSHSAYSLDFNSKSVYQMSSQRQMGCCVRAVLP